MTERNCPGVSLVAGAAVPTPALFDQDVDPAELVHRGADEARAVIRIGDVGTHGDSAAAFGLDELARAGQPVFPAGRNHEIGTRLRERLGESDAEAARCAGDDGDAAVEAKQLENRGHQFSFGQGISASASPTASKLDQLSSMWCASTTRSRRSP